MWLILGDFSGTLAEWVISIAICPVSSIHPSTEVWLAEGRLVGEVPMGRERRHIHPEIVNMHPGRDLLCMKVVERRWQRGDPFHAESSNALF